MTNENQMDTFPGRHPDTLHFLPLFAYGHLPRVLQTVSRPFHELAMEMAAYLPDGPELTMGLRKLLEAKDCMVRAKAQDMNERGERGRTVDESFVMVSDTVPEIPLSQRLGKMDTPGMEIPGYQKGDITLSAEAGAGPDENFVDHH